MDGTVAVTRRTVAWEPASGMLTVGKRAVLLTCDDGDNECILRTYLQLVAEQRHVPLDGAIVLRRDDIVVLAEILDLDDVELESILVRMLRISAPEAAVLRRRLRKARVGAMVLGAGLLAGVPVTRGLASGGDGPTFERVRTVEEPALLPVEAATTSPTTITVEAMAKPEAPAPPSAVADEPVAAPPVPAPDPGADVEIGYSVTYERDPDFVPPPGVEIGDALVIERDPPPPEG
jgi:hypothetical protein